MPGKNIRPLAGKPLIQCSIETALASPSISQVFVSTDDAAIASLANSLGTVIIERPSELATDTSPEWLAWRHAIEWVTAHYGAFDEFISLPATSPLRSVFDIEPAITKRHEQSADICIFVTPANRPPISIW
ncbi:cytidylyltransferase domain-containing protein [Aeromonas jandaei]|uniref:acylneuraminate cytidylyltransferase family protein n=1 Tax=Aeromonas jandaei TaxID=650 RepID=UPI003BA18774